MRRFLFPLLAFCLLLTGCGFQPSPPPSGADPASESGPAAPPSAEVPPLRFDDLAVEFTLGDRDPETLSRLRDAFPSALIDALGEQGVAVSSVSVTFGASGEATEAALRSGAVELAFLSAEDYYPFRSGMVIAVERGETPDLSLGLLVSSVSDDEAADQRFAEALRAALPALAPTLALYSAPYARGIYEYDSHRIDQLSLIYEEEAGYSH